MLKAFCGVETVRKKALLTLWALWEKNLPSESQASLFSLRVHSISHRFTQKNRTHSISQRHWVNRYHRTLQLILVERPLCSLYAEGVLWARNVRQKAQWTLCALWEKTLPRLREKTPQRVSSVPFLIEGAFYFSQIYTEEQNTQRLTETLSQPISQNLTANIHHPTPFFS